MRRLMTVLVALGLSVPMLANSTDDLLEAIRVKNSLQVKLNEKAVLYQTEDMKPDDFFNLKSGQTFSSRSPEVTLVLAGYDPFKVGIVTNVTGTVDPAAKAVADFAEALSATARVVAPGTVTPTATATTVAQAQAAAANAVNQKTSAAFAAQFSLNEKLNVLQERRRKVISQGSKATKTAKAELSAAIQDVQAWDAIVQQAQAEQQIAEQCAAVASAIATANAAMKTSQDAVGTTKTKFQSWRDNATGQVKIGEQITSITDTRETVKNALQKAIDAKTELDKNATNPNQGACDPLTRIEILGLYNIAANIDSVVAADRRLLQSLNDLIDMLTKVQGGQWVNGTGFVFLHVPVNSDTLQTVNMSFTPKTYTFDDTTQGTTVKDGEVTTSTVVLRAGRPFVPELGVAAIYNEIRYPKYKATTADGATTVTRTTDSSNVDAAMTLNFFCNCLPNTRVFPGFQLGVSKAKDYPGVLLGGVLRFSQMTKIAVSAGGLLTWYKELDPDKFHVGGSVPSQEELDKSLRRQSATGFYFGVQYTFGTP